VLTRIAIENFKGVRERVELELAPVTLLFGPNSAGKSTAIQALQYMHHLLTRGNPSADRTPHGGDSVDLGGFASFVHKHDTDLTVSVRVGFTIPTSVNVFAQDDIDFGFADLDDQLSNAWVEARVRREIGREGIDAAVTEMLIGAGSEVSPLARTSRQLRDDGGEELVAWLNLAHRLLRASASEEDAFLLFDTIGVREEATDQPGWWRVPIRTTKISALPTFDRPIGFLDDDDAHYSEDATDLAERRQLRTLLTMLLVGVPVLLSRELDGLTYVGPLRIVPGRGFVPERSARMGRWADGAGAWDLLALGGPTLRASAAPLI